MTNNNTPRRQGATYPITPDEIRQYYDQGYLVLENVLTEEEVAALEPWFDHFISGAEANRMGKDFCDMSQPYGTPIEEFLLVNAMLPSTYRPELENNIFFQVAQNIADQLYREGTARMDYEQFLAKKPNRNKAEFAMHQDLGYWPKTENTWTATFSLAINDATIQNGCLQVIPGTNHEAELRPHRPKDYGNHTDGEMDRSDSHTLVIESKPDDKPVFLPVKRGSITIHDERIVHGSGGNYTDDWRKTYVMAFRDEQTILTERSIGFTHSHNDSLDWQQIIQ